MSADPTIIGKYTQDGVLVTYQDDVLKASNPNALDAGEIDSFFRYEADALAMLTERASILGTVGGAHEAIEVTDQLGVGTTIGVTPIVPSWTIVDETRLLSQIVRTRAVSFDMTIDRYSLEVIQ